MYDVYARLSFHLSRIKNFPNNLATKRKSRTFFFALIFLSFSFLSSVFVHAAANACASYNKLKEMCLSKFSIFM